MTYFTIAVTPPTSAKVEQGGEATFSFTVTSLAAPDKVEDVVLEARVLGEPGTKGKKVDWIKPSPAKISLAGGKTFNVTIQVRPDAKTSKGPTKIQLVVAKERTQNDDYDVSEPVACEVEEPKGKPPAEKGTTPPWLIPLVVGAVVLLAGVVVTAILLLRNAPGLGKTCSAKVPACANKLTGTPKENRCPLLGGESCKNATDCASGECDDDGVCALPLGEACDPAATADGGSGATPCSKDGACDPTKKKCEGTLGAACATNDQCTTNACDAGACWAPSAAACTTDCPLNSACTDSVQCHSGSCANSKCILANVLLLCGDYTPGRCKNGNKCSVDAQCESAYCAPSTKTCADCPQPCFPHQQIKQKAQELPVNH